MEGILVWIVIFVVYYGLKALFSSGSNQIGALEMRQVPITLEEAGMEGVGLEIKGLIPVELKTNIRFVTSVLDQTKDSPNDEGLAPVLSLMESFQEAETPAYQCVREGPLVEPNHGFTDWVRVGVVFPALLQPGYGGRRKLLLISRVVDMEAPPMILMGLCPDQSGVISERYVEYEFDYAGKGYKEAAEHRDEARTHAIWLAMAVAMADGSLHEHEGHVMQEWIKRTIAPFGEERREELKELYNKAMRDSYAAVTAGKLVMTDVIARMNEIAEDPQKYEALTLCFDVMQADGTLADSEMREIRNISTSLGIDWSEFEALKDKALIGASSDESGQAGMEAILGIDPDWSDARTMTHLRQQYAKWNDRLNALPEGPERENAQRMLDLTAQARLKHDS